MATEKEEIILEVKIDQQQAEKDLVKVEKAIMANKEAVNDLSKAYKAGTITQEEFIEENIRLQANQKKEQDQKKQLIRLIDTESNSRNALKLRVSQLTKEYDNLNTKTAEGAKRADALQKELAQLNAEVTKSSKSAGLFKDQIGNYPQAFAEATKGINVYGISVGDVAGKMKSFLNPATALVGIVGLLGAAYSSSAAGAETLVRAQDRLRAGLDVVNNRVGNSKGGGIFGNVIDKFDLGVALANLTNLTREAAEYEKTLVRIASIELEYQRELEKDLLTQQGLNKTRERDAENFRRIRDDSERSYEERLNAAKMVEESMKGIQDESLKILEKQIKSKENYAEVTGQVVNGEIKNKALNLEIIAIKNEMADKQEEVNGKLTENYAAELAINKEIRDREEAYKALLVQMNQIAKYSPPPVPGQPAMTDEQTVAQAQGGTGIGDIPTTLPTISDEELDALEDQYTRALEASDEYYIMKMQRDAEYRSWWGEYLVSLEAMQEQSTKQMYNDYQSFFSALSGLFDEASTERKAFALASIGIDTAEAIGGLVAASESNPTNAVTFGAAGIGQYLAGIARILANVAAAKQYLNFWDGGYTGDGGKYDFAGYVHKGEYVTPKHVMSRPEAKPHVAALENLRLKGYADGGIVTSQATTEVDTQLMAANALRDMPAPILSLSEFQKEYNKLLIKQDASTLRT